MEKQLTLNSSLGPINCYKTTNDNVFCSLDTVTTIMITNKTDKTIFITSNLGGENSPRLQSIETIEPDETKDIICRRLIGNNKDLLFTHSLKALKNYKNCQNDKNYNDCIFKKITTDEKATIIQRDNELIMVKRYTSLHKIKSAVSKKSLSISIH